MERLERLLLLGYYQEGMHSLTGVDVRFDGCCHAPSYTLWLYAGKTIAQCARLIALFDVLPTTDIFPNTHSPSSQWYAFKLNVYNTARSPLNGY